MSFALTLMNIDLTDGCVAENAVAVATMAIGLNDPFNIDGFDEQRQGLMIALASCSPKNVAP